MHLRSPLSVAGGGASPRTGPLAPEAAAYYLAAGLVFVLRSPRFCWGKRTSPTGSCGSPSPPIPRACASSGWGALRAPPAPPPSLRGPPSYGARLLGGHR
ncbi:hypothetical protein NDU88_002803 [Pleurodeles waltl]|uniref:Uncharacterized protein n=1 Tax=Pleurodeles waltl TaxID=8319 RepID=A0AAV7M1P6_PLEWA|nr:hypothetical protein NDU88_002803 [Pleurodeles waltl]